MPHILARFFSFWYHVPGAGELDPIILWVPFQSLTVYESMNLHPHVHSVAGRHSHSNYPSHNNHIFTTPIRICGMRIQSLLTKTYSYLFWGRGRSRHVYSVILTSTINLLTKYGAPVDDSSYFPTAQMPWLS